MKKTLHRSIMPWLLGILFAAVSLASCQKTDSEMEAVAEQMSKEMKQDIEFISSLGYDVSDIEKADDGYLVEGDIWLTDQWLADAKKQSQTRLTKLSNLVAPQYQKKLYLNADNIPNAPTILWATTVRLAISEWNSLVDCNINISHTPSSDREELKITFASQDNMVNNSSRVMTERLMTVIPPSADGMPGSVKINKDCSFLPKDYFAHPDRENMQYLMMHAIGHALGLAHTLKPGEIKECEEDNYDGIKDTSADDYKSIMTREANPITWKGFSSGDKSYIRIAFPIPTAPPTPALTPGKIETTKTIVHGTTTLVINSTEAATGGSGTITYSWEKKSGTTWTVVSGQTGANLNIAVPSEERCEYQRKATDGKTTKTSNICVVTIQQFNPGSIAGTLSIDTQNPGDQITINSTGLAVCQSGATYAWEINTGISWAVIPGATGESLTTSAPQRYATKYKRKAVCGHGDVKYSNECTVYNKAFLTAGKIESLVELYKTGFDRYFNIQTLEPSSYPGKWEVNSGSGWVEYNEVLGQNGWPIPNRHLTKLRKRVITPTHGTVYSNECTVINHAVWEDPRQGTDGGDNAVQLGPYSDNFSKTLVFATYGEYFQDGDRLTGGGNDASMTLELSRPMTVEFMTGSSPMGVWLDIWSDDEGYLYFGGSSAPLAFTGGIYAQYIPFPTPENPNEFSQLITLDLLPGKYLVHVQGYKSTNGAHVNDILSISMRGTVNY